MSDPQYPPDGGAPTTPAETTATVVYQEGAPAPEMPRTGLDGAIVFIFAAIVLIAIGSAVLARLDRQRRRA